MTNPLLDFSGAPRFLDVEVEHISPAITALIAEAEAAVSQVDASETIDWNGIVLPVEDAVERLSRAWDLVDHLEGVISSPALRAAHAANLEAVSRFYAALGQHEGLYRQYKALDTLPTLGGDEAVRRHILANTLRDFHLQGADLSPDDKARATEIRAELSTLSQRFGTNVMDATDRWALWLDDDARLAGIPADSIAMFRAAAEAEGKPGYKLTLQAPSYIAVTSYADDRALRETLYRAYATRASEDGDAGLDNGPVMARILELRERLATLLGHASYADLALAPKMADTPDEVLTFLRKVAKRARPAAERDIATLRDYATGTLGLDGMEPWDNAYVAEKLKQSQFAFSSQDLKAYFREDKVLDGLFALIERLFAVRFVADETPGWHADVRAMRAIAADGSTVGQLFLDLYAREAKRGGAWMNGSRNRRRAHRREQHPIAYIVCNFGKGSDGRPATFTHGDVITLFHEMGHALHALLTDQTELDVSGINGVEWDAVELPSQFMENFCWEWDVLQTLTGHIDTGEPLPRTLFDRIIAARNFQAGAAATRQIEFGVFDMELHRQAGKVDPLDQWTRVREELSVLPILPWNRFPHSFSHIFSGGYAAGYYGYMWAEVMSADAYGAFTEAPAAIPDTAARFRHEILGRGGSRPASENFIAFRGRAPEPEALLVSRGIG